MAKAKGKESAKVYQLKITLNTQPPIWRRVQVKDCSLSRLHDVIQTAMGWMHSHLHGFEVGGEQYGEPDPMGMMETEDEGKLKLGEVAAQGHKRFSYTYDFGDSWEHTIQIEKTLTPEPGVRYPRCVEGQRACPPEDCGGTWGYADFLEAIQKPSHPNHEEMLDWIGGEFDPEAFDVGKVNKELGGTR
jgi:hypothetical protein